MKKALIGAGGFAREIKAHIGDNRIKCFVDDKFWKENNEYIFPLSEFNPAEYEVIVICAGCILTTNIKIGDHAHLNLNTTIGHDCTIENYFTTAPGVNVSGNCNISDYVYIGTNASLRQKLTICSNVTIGLNAGVVKDIKEPGTYVGVPAKILKNEK